MQYFKNGSVVGDEGISVLIHFPKICVVDLCCKAHRVQLAIRILSSLQGVKVDARGHIIVDDYQNTSAKGIYALGDVCEKFHLTPGMFYLRCEVIIEVVVGIRKLVGILCFFLQKMIYIPPKYCLPVCIPSKWRNIIKPFPRYFH